MKAGANFDLSKDSDILKINSPKLSINGPYTVVYKNVENRWAIIAFDWDKKPRLGIRWFWEKIGMPASRGHSTWLVIPTELTTSILNGLPLDTAFRSKIDDFLEGKIKGNDLKRK